MSKKTIVSCPQQVDIMSRLRVESTTNSSFKLKHTVLPTYSMFKIRHFVLEGQSKKDQLFTLRFVLQEWGETTKA